MGVVEKIPHEAREPAKRTVLFVDDEVRILDALKRQLRAMRHEWRMEFASDPRQALEMLREREFDALVTDMRMPQMDGSELLSQARALRPAMARIVLSGYSEREAALRAVGLAHQFLAKPCEIQTLRATVARACNLRELLPESVVAAKVCGIGRLPSMPKLYAEITAEIAGDDMSLSRIAAIIAQDIAMTAKILQVVNSAFFGLGRRILDVGDAVSYLGGDTIRSLVLSNAAFRAFECAEAPEFADLWKHSWLTGLLSKRIAELESKDVVLRAEALQAGMLHDVGHLILSRALPDEVAPQPISAAPGSEAQRAAMVTDHGSIGAYLMGLWGLSDGIVEALAYHHSPSQCSVREFGSLAIVHVADALVHEQLATRTDDPKLDLDYLAAAGLAGRIDLWRSEAQRILARGVGRTVS